MSLRKSIFILVLFCFAITSGCSGRDSASPIPPDFAFLMDIRGARADMAGNIHVNIRINSNGRGRFEYYDSGNGINYDLNKIVTYDASQIIEIGTFKLTDEKLEQLWNILSENHFFELDEHYQMALGHSYAFLLVEANGERQLVDNIGMEVPEVRAIVEAIRTLLPKNINFEYAP